MFCKKKAIVDIRHGSNKKKLALIVGHNSEKQGATNIYGETEYSFNKRIAKKVQVALAEDDFYCAIIERPAKTTYVKEVEAVTHATKELGVTHALCLHFNSYNSKVQGVEAMVYTTNTLEDNAIAHKFVKSINNHFPIPKRGVKEVGKGHRGSLMLEKLSSSGVIAVLLEPLFGDSYKGASVLFGREDDYVEVLVGIIEEHVYGSERF